MRFAFAVLVSLLTFVDVVNADDREVLWTRPLVNGGFGGMTLGTGYAGDNLNYWLGFKGAWLINHRYYIGAAGVTAMKPVATDQSLNTAGLLIGYKHRPHRVMHWAGELMVGSGSVLLNHSDTVDSFIVYEPALLAEINLDRYVVVNAGISYRYLVGATPDYSGYNILMNIVAGYF